MPFIADPAQPRLLCRTVSAMAAIALAAIPTVQGQSSPNDAASLLSKAQEATSWASESTTICRAENKIQMDGKEIQSSASDVRRFRSGGKLRIIEKQYITKNQQSDTGEADRLIADGVRVFFIKGISAQIASTPELIDNSLISYLITPVAGGFLDGYFNFSNGVSRIIRSNTSVYDLARSGKYSLRPATETVAGISCSIVEADTSIGHLAIWIAPSEDYNIAKVEFHRGGEGSETASHALLFDDASFDRVGERAVLTGGHLHQTDVDARGSRFDDDFRVHRTSIDFAVPSDPTIFSTSFIPNGTQVYVDEDKSSGINYIWQNGKAVPYKDNVTLASIKDQISQIRAEQGGAATQPDSAGNLPPISMGESSGIPGWMTGAGIACGVALVGLAGFMIFAPRKKKSA